MARLNTTKSLGSADEHPKTLDLAKAALSAHTWDQEYYDRQKKYKNKQNNNSNEEQNTTGNEDSLSPSFAQFSSQGKCYCCGSNRHAYKDCVKRNALKKEDWWINKQKDIQQYNQLTVEITTT